jgi:carbamoyl-phosphate synthase large subunit
MMIEKEGLPVQLITKKLTEGHPNVLDVIKNGWVDGVVNTITGERAPLRDGFAIRRAAAEKRIPCFTSLDTIRAASEALASRNRLFNVQPLREYLRR